VLSDESYKNKIEAVQKEISNLNGLEIVLETIVKVAKNRV